MKKTNQLVVLFSIVIVGLLSSCKEECNCDEQKKFTLPEGTYCYSDEGRQVEMLNYDEIIIMLRNYDQTRIAPLKEALGYHDSRTNTFNFTQFKKYLGRIEKLSKEANITISGISFISAATPNYAGTLKSYQDLIYIPTTLVDGKEIAFDPVQSVAQGRLVTFKQMLAKNGYNWIYNTKEEFEKGKREDNNYSTASTKQSKVSSLSAEESGAGNKGALSPPN